MKIVHLCLCGAMTDGFNYQENVITKYHKKMGFEVTIIASQWCWGTNGKEVIVNKSNYINDDGIKVVRLPIRIGSIDNRFKRYPNLYKSVEIEKPDILFIHGCQFLDICTLANYAKNNSRVRVFVDNHVDFENGAHGWLSKNILHKGIWRYCVGKIKPYVTMFYGVLPARVDFLRNVYKVPTDKCRLLVMGADDELVRRAYDTHARQRIRKKYNIGDDCLLVMSGGKINHYRPETLNLMKAVVNLNNPKIKLIVFGSVDEYLRDVFDSLCIDNNIIYVGWLKSDETYDYMAAADLMVFPGLHSVLWEQAVGMGIPCVFRDIKGFHHVDLGGNAIFIDDMSVESINELVQKLYRDKLQLASMKSIAEKKGMKKFSYMNIAKQSIDV